MLRRVPTTLENIVLYVKDAFQAFTNIPLDIERRSSVSGGLVRAFGMLFLQLVQAVDMSASRLSLDLATGDDLNRLGEQFGLLRRNGNRPEGYLSIYVTELPETAIEIPIGTNVTSDKQSDGTTYSYTVSARAVIPSSASYYPSNIVIGSTYPAVLLNSDVVEYVEGSDAEAVASQFDDSVYNTRVPCIGNIIGANQMIDAGLLTNIAINDVVVTNPEPTTGGYDFETDNIYRSRLKTYLRGVGTTLTEDRLKAMALVAGVFDAIVLSYGSNLCASLPDMPFNSVLLVVNIGTYAQISRDDLLVASYVTEVPVNIVERLRNDLETYRPAGVGITVREANVVGINFVDASNTAAGITITVKHGVNLIDKKSTLRNMLYSRLLEWQIGQPIYRSDIINILKDDADVVDVDTTFKFASTVCGTTTNLTSVTVIADQVVRIGTAADVNLTLQETV